MHRARRHAIHQRVKTGHHEALDVVSVTVRERLTDGVFQTSHVGVTAPKKRRQWLLRIERIAFGVVGHLRPVNATHVFTPPQHLADEAFDRFQWRVSIVVGLFCGGDDFARVDQFEVERAGDV